MQHSHFEDDFKLNYIIISRDDKVEKKCTLYPLRGRADFSFRTRKKPGEFRSDSILLFPDGESITEELVAEIREQIDGNEFEKDHNKDAKGPSPEAILDIVLIDSRWKKVKGVLDSLPPLKRVSLEGYETGAVRREPPPSGGLASVEALYLTSLLFGKPDPTLLEKYHFRQRFFEINGIKSP
jgi:hypothetical protein